MAHGIRFALSTTGAFTYPSGGMSLFGELINTAGLGGAQRAQFSPWRWVQVLNGNVSF
jgi:hypothetical protein